MDVDSLLIDIDGVLTHGGEPLPGAVDAVQELRSRLPVRFLTNTSRKSSYTLLAELEDAGFDIARNEVFTAPMAAASHLRDRGAERVLPLTSDDLKKDLTDFTLADDEPDHVLVGDMGTDFGYNTLNSAFQCLMADADLVAIHKNRYWNDGTGPVLDAGPFVAALEYASGKKATVVGKPSKTFFHAALDDVGTEPGLAAMIGDDVYADIIGAAEAGLRTVLVKQGKYRPDVFEKSGADPDHAVDNLPDVLDLIGA